MEAERWKRVDDLLQAALERPPAGRAVFLRQACAGDEALEREVRSLVASEEAAGGFLLSPAIEVAAGQWLVSRIQTQTPAVPSPARPSLITASLRS